MRYLFMTVACSLIFSDKNSHLLKEIPSVSQINVRHGARLFILDNV